MYKNRNSARTDYMTRDDVKRKRRRRFPRFRWLLLLIAVIGISFMFLRMSEGGALDGLGNPFKSTPKDPEIPDWVTQDFLTVNEFSRPGTAIDEVNGVVIHYIGNPGTTAKANRNYFQSLSESGETSASSHFIIDTDGSVIQCVPLTEIAYCSNQRNKDTISIEVCHPDVSGEFTSESYDTLIELVSWLVDTYDLDRDEVLRHSDVNNETPCPIYYTENPEAWEQLKDDIFS